MGHGKGVMVVGPISNVTDCYLDDDGVNDESIQTLLFLTAVAAWSAMFVKKHRPRQEG